MSTTAPTVATPLLLPTTTRLGPIHIAVTDPERALAIWRDVVGLTLLARHEDRLELGAGDSVLVVLETGASGPVPQHTIGLYHVAIHVPTRRDLARMLNRAIAARVRISPTDHLVSEALYLWDLDGNGIEITFETPWRGRFVEHDELMAITHDGKPHSGREPIDVPGLLAELDGDETPMAPMPEKTRIGHVHVHVDDLDTAMDFYRDKLGFAGQLLSRRYGMGDVSLDYVPHILAFNIWAGRNPSLPPEGVAGLRWFEIVVESDRVRSEILGRLEAGNVAVTRIEGGIETRDPAGNRVKILVG
ncbi:VOC family protein [Pelagibacterium luteolum]|uniref:Catechol 2,3-dioxygenase n=1 Tax=Pelagibacterium luteolum TaxID=440168 RepID=A0A1G7WQE8_9HYPH|nr:VOC family protein [Pelagibacterium luteolum]SDG74129.1 catechol 2,3-dioxygenase [Pelagibacterium luteolum]